MIDFYFSFDFPEAELKKLEQAIIKQVSETITRKLITHKTIIQERIVAYLTERFWSNEVVKSLISNDPQGLRSQMGLNTAEAQRVLDEILRSLINSIQIIPYKEQIGDRIEIGTRFTIIKDNYENLLRIPGTSYKAKGYNIDWLKWILYNAGEFVLVTKHDIKTDLNSRQAKRSRSGLSIMVKNNSSVWKVPDWIFTTGHKNFIEQITTGIENRVKDFVDEQV